MASFMEDLWKSIFTPGPTSTLLVATNASFAALQLVLAGLLFATWSVHFVVLSVLSAGLWASINWFAGEVRLAQAEQEAAARQKSSSTSSSEGGPGAAAAGSRTAGRQSLHSEAEAGDELDSSADDTETELADSAAGKSSFVVDPVAASTGFARGLAPGSSASTSQPLEQAKRRAGKRLSESTGDVSTDSEWEKVDEDR